jgi:hypothetical protein
MAPSVAQASAGVDRCRPEGTADGDGLPSIESMVLGRAADTMMIATAGQAPIAAYRRR